MKRCICSSLFTLCSVAGLPAVSEPALPFRIDVKRTCVLTCQAHICHWCKDKYELQCCLLCSEGGIKALKGAPVLKPCQGPGRRPAWIGKGQAKVTLGTSTVGTSTASVVCVCVCVCVCVQQWPVLKQNFALCRNIRSWCTHMHTLLSKMSL
jgi:hypothetical protein